MQNLQLNLSELVKNEPDSLSRRLLEHIATKELNYIDVEVPRGSCWDARRRCPFLQEIGCILFKTEPLAGVYEGIVPYPHCNLLRRQNV